MTTGMIEKNNASQNLMQLLSGFWISQSLYVAAKLGVSDALKAGPKSVADLAACVGADTASLYRVLRALASIGFYRESAGKTFELTPMAELLCTGHPDSMRPMVLMLGQENYTAWGRLYDGVRAGTSPFELAYGTQAYEYFAQNPESGEIFNAAMSALVRNVHAAVAEVYDFSGLDTIVDVGGGNGALLATVLKHHPSVSAILFELPQVMDEARQFVEQAGITERCKLVPGNFFESVVEGGDAYILAHIMHTFSDDLCVQILRRVHQAMPPHGKLLVIEDVLQPGNDPTTAKTKFMDVNMLVFTPSGREHTREEFAELFEQAGFRLSNIFPTATGTAVIEAVKQ